MDQGLKDLPQPSGESSLLKRVADLVTGERGLIAGSVAVSGVLVAALLVASGNLGRSGPGYFYRWWAVRSLVIVGWAGLGADAYVEHRGTKFSKRAMWIPTIFAPAGVAIQIADLASGGRFSPIGIAADLLATIVGVYGFVRHLQPHLREGVAMKRRILGTRPPVLVPLTFAGMGLLDLVGRRVRD
jgi:hypothetical protein